MHLQPIIQIAVPIIQVYCRFTKLVSCMSLRGKMYAVNGIHLHVVEKGRQGAPVIIFLHGFPEFWYGWHHQMDFFMEKGYRVLLPDQRGYNLSDKPIGLKEYQLNELVKDITGLIHASGEKKVFLVGHDWGGAVAWRIASQSPLLIHKLIILNMPHPRVMRKTVSSNVKQMIRSWYIGFFQIPGLPEKVLQVNNHMVLASSLQRTSLPGTFTPYDLQLYRQAWQQKNALSSMINWYRAALQVTTTADYPDMVEMPTLIIWGEKDHFLRKEMAEESLVYCKHGELHKFPDATHWIHHEKSNEVNELIWQFIR